jgi:hypothetical protein
MGFELTILVLERTKRVHALDRGATVISVTLFSYPNLDDIYLIRIVGVETKLGPLDTSTTSGPLYLSRVIVRMKDLVE